MRTLPATDQEPAAWLPLSMAPGLRPGALRAMLDASGLPDASLGSRLPCSPPSPMKPPRAAPAPPADGFARDPDVVLAWRELEGNAIVTLDDPVYPPARLTMPDPPALLYIKGRLDLLHAKGVALVGSRSATPQGVEDAERFARALSEAGLAVVSGLAPGIDGAARRGAMAGRGSAIAVIGTCANLVYPAAHQPLARQIAAADEADPGPGVQKPLAAPGHAPATLEIPAARTDMQDAALQGTLLQPELAGHLTVLPGGRLARASHR